MEGNSCSVVSNSLQPHELQSTTPLSMELSRQEYWSGLSFPTWENKDHGIWSQHLSSELYKLIFVYFFIVKVFKLILGVFVL